MLYDVGFPLHSHYSDERISVYLCAKHRSDHTEHGNGVLLCVCVGVGGCTCTRIFVRTFWF